jgi:ABC-type transport system involved in multi-copper enzyme maturation permease subunit
VRQNIIDGWSRDQYISAKFGVLLTTTLFITLLIVVTAFLFGLKNGGDAAENLIYIFYAFVQSLAYLSLAFFLGVYMKRAGIAIAIYVMYAYVGEFVIAGLLDYKVVRHLGAFLPLESTDRLIPGLSNFARKLVDQGNPPPSNTTYVLIALAYIALFNFLSWRKIKKADL